MNKYFGDKNFYRRVLAVAVPIMIQNGITNFVNMLDNIMVGQLGTDPISGVAIINQLMFVFNLCLFGALSGIGIFTAQYYGKGDHQGVRYTFRMQVITGVVVVLIGLFAFLKFGDAMVLRFLTEDSGGGSVEGTLQYAHMYMMFLMMEVIPFTAVQVYANTLRNTGETVVPMRAGIIAVIVNLVGNYILIYGKFGAPALGVRGAAIATVLSRFVEFLVVAVWTHTHTTQNQFIVGAYKHLFDVPGSLVITIIPKALPLLLNETLWSAGQTVLVRSYSLRGLSAVTALNICNTIANVFNVAFIAMGSAIAIILGQLLGAGKIEKAKEDSMRLCTFSVLMCVGTGTLLFLSSYFFPLIYNTTDEIRLLARHLIMAAGVFSPLYAFTNASYFTIRSGGRTGITFLFDCGFVWAIGIPFALLLTHCTGFDMLTIYILVNATELIKSSIGYFMMRSGTWAVNLTEIME